MGEMNEPAAQQALGKNSQVARLKKIIKETRVSLITGVVLLVLLIIASVSYVRITYEQLESTMSLSQYRMGSKTLTTAVQSYAITGDTQYYEAYIKELNVDKNRDAAWEILQRNDIKADEWEGLNEIAALSNGLVPLEEEAMAAVAAGNTQTAVEFVFGSEYAETIQRINDLTDDTINKILTRLEAKKARFLILEIICVIAFVAAFIRLALDSMQTIRFFENELLAPIIKVSEQMTALAHGNLHAELDLEKDDSEVGNMVASIDFMKNNLAGIIEELKRAADSAIRAEQAKSRFLSNMSHEIRTPLNAILGMNEMILRECTDPQLRSYSGNIQSSGRTLLTLINDILDMSKIESGKMEIMPTEYKTADLLLDLWNVIYLRAKDKNLTLSFTLDETMPCTLYGDDVRVKQIVTNLLTNAVKYTSRGGVELHASYERQGEDGLLLIISVRDTGIGIRKEDQGRLFESFRRLDEDQNRNIEGTGLGMSITMMLLKMMEGEIEVESVYQKGSTFTVRIPQKVLDDEAVGDFESIRSRQPLISVDHYGSFEAPGADILVVDDNAMNLAVFTSLLKVTKMNIATAGSGKECLELVKEKRYHMIFMDHMMPEMDGVETFHEIQKLEGSPNEKTPVIALTANSITGVREYFLEEGFADFLSKPIDSERLERMIVEHLPEELVHKKGEGAEESSPAKASGTAKASGAADDHSRYLGYGISIEKGLSNAAGDRELYLDIIEMFIHDEEKQALLRRFITEQNAQGYGIQVHALKGDARILGAEGLADIAYEHERQSKAGNLSYVEEHWDELTACWERVRTGFGEFYRESGRRQDEASETAVPVTDEEGRTFQVTAKEIEEVAAWIDAFETQKAAERMKGWLKEPLEPEQRRRITGALAAIEKEYDEDKAIGILTGP